MHICRESNEKVERKILMLSMNTWKIYQSTRSKYLYLVTLHLCLLAMLACPAVLLLCSVPTEMQRLHLSELLQSGPLGHSHGFNQGFARTEGCALNVSSEQPRLVVPFVSPRHSLVKSRGFEVFVWAPELEMEFPPVSRIVWIRKCQQSLHRHSRFLRLPHLVSLTLSPFTFFLSFSLSSTPSEEKPKFR